MTACPTLWNRRQQPQKQRQLQYLSLHRHSRSRSVRRTQRLSSLSNRSRHWLDPSLFHAPLRKTASSRLSRQSSSRALSVLEPQRQHPTPAAAAASLLLLMHQLLLGLLVHPGGSWWALGEACGAVSLA